MSVRIARGVITRIRDDPSGIVIQVQEASSASRAAAALERAGVEIGELDGGWRSAYGLREGDRNNPKWVSAVIVAPTGPCIDGGSTPHRLLRTIPEIVARHVRDAGVSHAVIAAPARGGELAELHALPRAVILCLYGEPASRVQWLEEAAAWVTAGCAEAGELRASVIATEFSVQVGDVHRLLAECVSADQWVRLVAGDRAASVRAVNLPFGDAPMVLSAGGPRATDEDRLRAFAELRAIAQRLSAHVTQAYIDLVATLGGAALHQPDPPWSSEGGEHPGRIRHHADRVLFDAFPYQIVGPLHMKRLGALPEGARALQDGRVELSFGEPADWLPRQRDAARRLLDPCLVGIEEALRLHELRFPVKAEEPIGSGSSELPRFDLSQSIADSRARYEVTRGHVAAVVEARGERLSEDEFDARLRAAWMIDVQSRSRRVPPAIARQTGIATAVAPEPDARDPFDHARVVTLALYPPLVAFRAWPPLPQPWFDELSVWLAEGCSADARIAVQAYDSVYFNLGLDEVAQALRDSVGSGEVALQATSGDWRAKARSLALERNGAGAILRAGGTQATDEDLLLGAERLKDVARRLAPGLAHAYLAVGGSDGGYPPGRILDQRGRPPLALMDERVLDGQPYQILGPRHIARLGGPPPGAKPLPGDRVELAIGELEAWIPRVRDDARRQLLPCLVWRDQPIDGSS
jgi:hypothetical protein